MKLGELLQMLEGYNPETEVCIADQDIRYAITDIAVMDWGRYINIYTAVKPFEEDEE